MVFLITSGPAKPILAPLTENLNKHSYANDAEEPPKHGSSKIAIVNIFF